jgi:hypothetical protein
MVTKEQKCSRGEEEGSTRRVVYRKDRPRGSDSGRKKENKRKRKHRKKRKE